MIHPPTILTITADKERAAAMGKLLENRGYRVEMAHSLDAALDYHVEVGADLALLVLPLPDGPGRKVIKALVRLDAALKVVVVGADDQVKGAPEAIEVGALDYLPSVEDDKRLLTSIGIAVGSRRTDTQLRYLHVKDASRHKISTMMGRCPAMRRVFGLARRVCHQTHQGAVPTVLLTGETGTGKGLLAKALHYNSARRNGPFLEINCAALPSTLVERELFGHVRGAYTDAHSSVPGLFESSSGGSLLLDEISSASLDLQSRLLTAIAEKAVRRLGSSKSVALDVQIIAATNRDLSGMVRENLFRNDLYHRLNVIKIRLPPLRERGEDKLLLAEAFIEELCRQRGFVPKRLTEDAKKAIQHYAWPGNVRELRNQLERIVMLVEGEAIDSSHFHFTSERPVVEVQTPAETDLTVRLPEGACPLEQVEKQIIVLSLKKYDGNVSQTARYLQISRHTLIYRMKKYGISQSG